MTPETYSELLKDLQKREKTLVPAYLATLRADAGLQERLQARFEAAEIGGRFDDFAAMCCRRSAVQFLLRTVYVRVLEDLGALDPPRIRGEWGLAAFREVAPALGVREFFRWTFRDLARDLPALFNAAPEELPLPSEDLCRETWDLWHRMSGDKPVYAWTSDTFASRFLGDLYQDLDAEVRKRFALLQTPDFVEKYILDHTLTPALKEFDPAALRAKGECFRIIDPTCGSGHFLIGAFHRLADYWQAHGVADPWEAAQRALESVWGCDINPHAVDIARFRLMLEVHARTGVAQIEKLASLTFNLRAMDSLIPWERGATTQGELFPAIDRLAKYATPGERSANANFLHNLFQVIVGNPPYISPKDPRKREDYRLFWPGSAAGKYALSAPFIERLVSLGVGGAYTGQITSNSFVKRQFGRAVIQAVFSKWLLTDVIDTSGAYVPGHGTPTVILFIRRLEAAKSEVKVRSVLNKKGEPRRPAFPEQGLVWQAILRAPNEDDDSSPFITVSNRPRADFQAHPWTLGAGVSGELLANLVENSHSFDDDERFHCVIGNLTKTILDDVYFGYPPSAIRDNACNQIGLVEGARTRDWAIENPQIVLYPYNFESGEVLSLNSSPSLRHFWRFRGILEQRMGVGFRTVKARGLPFFVFPFHSTASTVPPGICFPFVSTHNHFAITHGRFAYNRTAPLIRLHKPKKRRNGPPPSGTIGSVSADDLPEDLFSDLAGLLNSSTLGFWMKQVLHNKGNSTDSAGARTTGEYCFDTFEYDSSKLLKAPIVERDSNTRVVLAHALDSTASERATCLPQAVLKVGKWAPSDLEATLAAARERYRVLTHRMVALQEELDWLTYGSYQLIDPVPVVTPGDIEPLTAGHRPFEILFARADDEADDEEKSAWWSRHGHDRVTEIPPHYSEGIRTRIQARMDLIESDPKLQLIEQAAYKRRWQAPDLDAETKSAAESYLLDRLEDLFAPGGPLAKPTPYRLEQITDAWSRDPRTKAVARVWKGGDVDLTLAAEQLLRAHGLPDNPRRIYTPEGLRTLAVWQKTWALQDLEDQGKPLVDPDTGKPLDTIELPPKFDRTHFQSADAFSIRGKLNVPRERFIVFADLKPSRYGWNGWRDTDRALAQVDAYSLAETDPQDPLPPPTAADPRRCGPTLGLWDSLPDVRRWGDASTHAELLALAQEVCAQKSCPCDVVDAWQVHQLEQQREARAKRPGRKASLPVVAQSPAPVAAPIAARPPADPGTIAVTIEDRDFVFRLIEPFGEGGATIADLGKSWARQPGLLAHVLDDLIASGDIKTRGRGKKKTYIAPSTRRPSET